MSTIEFAGIVPTPSDATGDAAGEASGVAAGVAWAKTPRGVATFIAAIAPAAAVPRSKWRRSYREDPVRIWS
ncbi:MAG TPA: hypothetical protein VNP95_13125 [Thermomicrobiales bacterium]|nr:hypothetical protein [Thermomicrobiales bacterium]